MFGPEYTAGCPDCSMIADGFDGSVVHLANHDVMLWAVSRAPLAKLQAYKRRMGWTFPWASSFGSDAMDVTPAAEPVVELAAMVGTDAATYTTREAGHERVRARGRRRL
jgi:predicted dithiol-disulfide oxidoreductase (DUF899 family)